MTSCCLTLIGINVSIIPMLTGITLTVNISESVFTTDMIKMEMDLGVYCRSQTNIDKTCIFETLLGLTQSLIDSYKIITIIMSCKNHLFIREPFLLQSYFLQRFSIKL